MVLNNLKYFYEVAKIEHITKAAENLHIAQPALSKALKSLETELGVSLFIKVGRRIKLSEYGIFLKNKLEPILQEIDRLPYNVQNMVDMGKNTITINVLAASTIITDIIIKYKILHRNVIFKMTQKEDSLGSDILVYTNNFKPEKMVQTKNRAIIEEQIYVAVPKDSAFANNDSIDLCELKHSDFIALSGSRRFRPLCDNYCAYAGFKPNIIFESDSLISVKNLISSGVGFAFWPEFSWGKIDDKNIKLLKINNPKCYREIILYQTANKQSHLCDDFFDFLINGIKNH